MPIGRVFPIPNSLTEKILWIPSFFSLLTLCRVYFCSVNFSLLRVVHFWRFAPKMYFFFQNFLQSVPDPSPSPLSSRFVSVLAWGGYCSINTQWYLLAPRDRLVLSIPVGSNFENNWELKSTNVSILFNLVFSQNK